METEKYMQKKEKRKVGQVDGLLSNKLKGKSFLEDVFESFVALLTSESE